ncbi:MAG: YicC/YloC family endoribonuclease [Kiloniellales bacterium]
MARTAPLLASMTGFARQDGGDGKLIWHWELKTVNGRGLDVRCRLPQGYDLIETRVRQAVQKALTRGNVQVSLSVTRTAGGARLAVNREVLDQVVTLIGELQGKVAAEPPRLDGLLALRGVLEPLEEEERPEERDARETAMLADLERALVALVNARQAEGRQLAAAVEALLAEIAGLVEAARAAASAQPAALAERLKVGLAELQASTPALSEERLAQEVALLAAKADVREELDRLAAHILAGRELAASGGAVGRRLDFLCQEFNREANTLCSKAGDVALTRIGLDLKAAIDQLREQIQNIE